MTRHIHLTPSHHGRYRYQVAFVDNQGKVCKQHQFATDTQTVRNVDMLLRMGYELTEASQAAYLQLMQHDGLT